MGKYKLEIKKSALKEIERLPRRDLHAVISRMEELSDNPRPHGCKKLSGQDKYKIRSGDYRILYSIEDNILTVYVVKVGHRRDVYR